MHPSCAPSVVSRVAAGRGRAGRPAVQRRADAAGRHAERHVSTTIAPRPAARSSSPTSSSSPTTRSSTRTTASFFHVVDTDEEQMWTDDHNPPTPTSAVEAGPDDRIHADDLRARLSRTSATRRSRSGLHSTKDRAARLTLAGRGHRPARVQGRHASSCCRRPKTCSRSSRTAGIRRKRPGPTRRSNGSGPRRTRRWRSRTRRRTRSSISSWTARRRATRAPAGAGEARRPGRRSVHADAERAAAARRSSCRPSRWDRATWPNSRLWSTRRSSRRRQPGGQQGPARARRPRLPRVHRSQIEPA